MIPTLKSFLLNLVLSTVIHSTNLLGIYPYFLNHFPLWSADWSSLDIYEAVYSPKLMTVYFLETFLASGSISHTHRHTNFQQQAGISTELWTGIQCPKNTAPCYKASVYSVSKQNMHVSRQLSTCSYVGCIFTFKSCPCLILKKVTSLLVYQDHYLRSWF